MCLEFCEQGGEIASRQLKDISQHLNVVSAVSFEKYTLGENMTLIDNNLTPVIIILWFLISLTRYRFLIRFF